MASGGAVRNSLLNGQCWLSRGEPFMLLYEIIISSGSEVESGSPQ